jgi:hypothetical protein
MRRIIGPVVVLAALMWGQMAQADPIHLVITPTSPTDAMFSWTGVFILPESPILTSIGSSRCLIRRDRL